MPTLPEGRWFVRRETGLLPPRGITKRITTARGTTYLLGVGFGRFDVVRRDATVVLEYRIWPIRDVLRYDSHAECWRGAGLVFGWRFCRFRLEPVV